MNIKKIKYKDYLYKWLLNKKNFIKESSYANYSNLIFNYIFSYLGDLYLNNLNHEIIQNYILKLYDNNLSIKTIKDIISIIKSSLYKAFDENKIKSFNLRFNYPKDKSLKTMYVLSKNEQNKIIKYILNNINNKNIGILFSLYLGIRIGELCALKWEDIDFDTSVLYINKTIQRVYIKDVKTNISKIIITTPKSKKANRSIPISKDFLKILKNIKTNNNDYILSGNNKYIEPRSYRAYFKKLLNNLSIKQCNFHTLRHTFATNCISLGLNYKTVSELLGHSNINITLNLYVHPTIEDKRKCINTIYKSVNKC